MTIQGVAVLGFVTCVVSGCVEQTPEMQLIHDAAEAMGGEDAIVNTETLLLEGDGEQYRLGQNSTPSGALTYWEVDQYRHEIDLVNDQWRVIQTRTARYETGNPMLREEQTFGLDGDTAYNISEDGTVARASAHVAGDRRADYYHHPVALVQLALAEGTMVGNLRQQDGRDTVDITSPSGKTYTLFVDPETRVPSQIVSTRYNTNLGDVTLTTRFEDYWETGGLGGFQRRLTMPREISVAIDDVTTWELGVTTTPGADLGDLGAPEEARSAPPPEFRANVQVEEIGDGLWLLAGQSHHSALVEFDEFLALVEAPQHDARTLAVIEKARELQPDKPLRYVVNTHHHFDHSGGIRAAVSAGLTVIAHTRNAEFFEDIVRRPHTLQPDALARTPQELSMELVGNEPYELSDGRRTMQIARMRLGSHADAMLLAYLPRERILIEADAYTPNARVAPFAGDLLEAINDFEWQVDRIVPLHGGVTEMARLQETVEAEANRR